MARKSRSAARGRHNKARLRRINEELLKNEIAAQPSLTKAEQQLRKLHGKEEKKKEVIAVEKPQNLSDSPWEDVKKAFEDEPEKLAQLEKKAKRAKRREQSEKARKEKLERRAQNKSLQK